MARFFDAQAALANLRGNPIHPIRPIPASETPENCTNSMNSTGPCADAFEEPAAILEFDAALKRPLAEARAARAQGFGSVIEFRAALSKKGNRDD